jgi:tetratricopeptide (TPR) repeat protein
MPMSIQQRLETALTTNNFLLLSHYNDPTSWTTMTQDERELLGLLLIKQGEHLLKDGDNKALESFELASKVAPFSAVIFFQQALALSFYSQNIRCLMAAANALEKAIQLEPNFIAAWYGWGCTITDIGTLNNDSALLFQAHDKFEEANRLAQSHESLLPDEFFWQWGICWYRLGKISGEAVDFFKALEKYRVAANQVNEKSGSFCNDYGNVLVEIAFLIGRNELLIEAAEQYKLAVAKSPNESEAWINLACTYQNIYEITDVEEYFLEANECFEQAIEIDGNNYQTWLKWGALYAFAGKKLKDPDRIQFSLNKFEKANACEPNNALILARWSEAQMLIASYNDNLDLLREAELKISLSIKLEPDVPAFWYISGMCLSELGRYFNDIRYLEQAIVKLQYAHSLCDSTPAVHHGLALAYYTIGEMTANTTSLEKSLPYFSQAIELSNIPVPDCWNDWGVALMKLGEFTNEKKHIENAVEKFEKAIGYKFNETSKDIELEWLYNYGCAMDFLGDFHEEAPYYEKSIQILTHVLHVDPEYSHARYNLALSFSHLGELNSEIDCFLKAIEHFKILLENDNEDEFAWNDWGLALTHLAVLTFDSIHPEFSQDYFEQAEKKFHHASSFGNTHTYYNLACLYALTNNMAAAMHYLERADFSDSLPPTEDVMHDEWLDNMRNHPPFRAFISHLLNKPLKDEF